MLCANWIYKSSVPQMDYVLMRGEWQTQMVTMGGTLAVIANVIASDFKIRRLYDMVNQVMYTWAKLIYANAPEAWQPTVGIVMMSSQQNSNSPGIRKNDKLQEGANKSPFIWFIKPRVSELTQLDNRPQELQTPAVNENQRHIVTMDLKLP